MTKFSGIILCGGFSKRFGEDKGLKVLFGKPMILYVIEKISPLVDELIVVTGNKNQYKKYLEIMNPSIKLIEDSSELKAPLIGASSGFKVASGEYSILLACDNPLISEKIISFLLSISEDQEAIIPRWPSGYIEPLQAVYKTRIAFKKSIESIENGILNISNMISKMRVLYVSTQILKKLDPKLHTFYNINTQKDLLVVKKILSKKIVNNT